MAAVEDVAKNRMKLLQLENPDLIFEDDHMDTEFGDRGLIRTMDRQGNVIGLEFIEPEELWADPDAVEEYADTVAEGIRVTVIVPVPEKEDAEALLHQEVGEGVTVLSYDDLGASLRPSLG